MTADTNAMVARWVRPEIAALRAYQVGDASGCIKLDAMENPYGWPAELQAAWLASLEGVTVNRYPDPSGQALRAALRTGLALPPDQELLLGNGSDELIQMIAMTLAAPGRVLLSVEPSFVMYRMIATFCGLEYVGVPLRAADFALDMPALRAAIAEHEPAVIFLAYPNNPTGNAFAADELRELLALAPGLVVIDEAYGPFAAHSMLGELGRHPNLVVMRTLSKMGLAGLRLGYLAGAPAWLGEFDKVRLPYNINVLSQHSVRFALAHPEVFSAQTETLKAERAREQAELAALPGVEVFPSEANFLLVRTPPGRAGELFEGLRERRILIKRLDGAHPLLHDCLRITVGTPAENDQLLAALRDLL